MSYQADAWVIEAGEVGRPCRARLKRTRVTVESIRDDEVLAAPVCGCWEGNTEHALARTPIDICQVRREPQVVLGNAGVVRVLETGKAVTQVRAGQLAMMFPSGETDAHGYTVKALGYEAPGQMGCMATLMKLHGAQLIPLPENSRHTPAQWAAFSVRYVTAWANWRLASAVFRLQVPKEECPTPQAWGWGGGTTLAELTLAKSQGWRAVMLSGSPHHLDEIQRAGLEAIDRNTFGRLSHEPHRMETDRDYRQAYLQAEMAFLAEVARRTEGAMVHVFLDYIGTPVHRATLRALARQGVLATAGWKEGMELTLLRARECITRHQHIHTHFARYQEGLDAMAYGEARGWMPQVDSRLYTFDELPALADDYHRGATGYFPCFLVNAEEWT
ncbi:zinc-binding alcohol dehydrogenase family protein [Myxococcaceae bacterium JPH2]|nr:zinc-binding alcohol dehydrogenase family protein [Myxococcaceae bacterium JPH2]